MSRAFLCYLTLALTIVGCGKEATAPTSRPATQPATSPATHPATARSSTDLKSLLDVVRADDVKFPTTQPLTENLEYAAAARLRLAEPIYLDGRGDLWITRADAPPTPTVLVGAVKLQTHVTREPVSFVYWRQTQELSAELIAREGDHDLWITSAARLPLDKAITRDWSRAGAWTTDAMQAAVVPTSTGVSVIRITAGKVDEQHVALLDVASPGSSTQYVLDPHGLLAWSIDPLGSSKVARFLDGKWTLLTPDPSWPAKLIDIIPFLDGTVLAIGEDGTSLQLKSVAIEAIPVDDARVNDLVKLLVNRDPKQRERAQSDLANIGPGAWPTLRKLAPTQPPEARIRIRAILGTETTPTLSGITPIPGPARLVSRLRDGGVVLRFDAGASAVNSNGVVQTFAPAWLAVRSGEPAYQLSDALTDGLGAGSVGLSSWGDEWIVEHDVDGPKRWMGNHTEPMLRKNEIADFKRFSGIDSMGRWIFKTIDPAGPTLVVDPTLPDPKPRLPIWTIDVNSSTVGWNDDDWAVMRRGGAFILKGDAWQAMRGDVDAMLHTALPTEPSTPATTQTTTQPTNLLLIDAEGNRYFDGRQSLIVHTRDGRHLTWTLPAEATGDGAINGEPVLVEAEGKLFLFNSPGKLQRLTKQFAQPNFDATAPFTLDAVFSRNIPGTDIRRFWKDPAGRLIFASGGNRLSIAFPSGRISTAMSNMIPARALQEALKDED